MAIVDILASVPGVDDAEKMVWLCEFYDAVEDLLIDHDVWRFIGDDPADAAEYIGHHGLPPLKRDA